MMILMILHQKMNSPLVTVINKMKILESYTTCFISYITILNPYIFLLLSFIKYYKKTIKWKCLTNKKQSID